MKYTRFSPYDVDELVRHKQQLLREQRRANSNVRHWYELELEILSGLIDSVRNGKDFGYPDVPEVTT